MPTLRESPLLSPPALLRVPLALVAGSAVGVVATTIIGVLTAQRAADRRPAADILKLDV